MVYADLLPACSEESGHLYEERGTRKGSETMEGANEISLSLLYGIHDEEIKENFLREDAEQKTQDAKGTDSGAYWVSHSLQFFGSSAQCPYLRCNIVVQ